MDNNLVALNGVFHALADPTRRAVLQALGEGPATVGELARSFDMALPSFLKHIGVLEASGLIGSKKTGRVRTCFLKREALTAAERWFDDQRQSWEARYSNLDTLLTTLKGEDDDDDK